MSPPARARPKEKVIEALPIEVEAYGLYGTNYLQRALITAIGLGANRPEDAVYPASEGATILESYTGEKKYLVHFPKDRAV